MRLGMEELRVETGKTTGIYRAVRLFVQMICGGHTEFKRADVRRALKRVPKVATSGSATRSSGQAPFEVPGNSFDEAQARHRHRAGRGRDGDCAPLTAQIGKSGAAAYGACLG